MQLNYRRLLQSDKTWFALLIGIFILSRITIFALGVRFDMAYFEKAWQFIDPTLLKNNLAQSVWYLHSQPPLFNLLMGTVLKIAPTQFTVIFQGIFYLAGLTLTITLFSILKKFRIVSWLAFSVTTLFILSPSVLLFENLFFYDYLVLVLLVLALGILQKFVHTQKTITLFYFFLLLSILALTRSLFHVVWILVIVGIVLVYYRTQWRKILLTALVPCLLVVGWYSKNFYYFGSFGASSWMGMGVYKTVMFLSTNEQRQQLFEQGITSGNFSADPFGIDITKISLPNFNKPELLSVPIVGQKTKPNGNGNFNYYGYLTLSKNLMQDFKSILRHQPSLYLKGIVGTATIFFAPASNFLSSNLNAPYNNYEVIKPWNRLYEWVVYIEPLGIGEDKAINFVAEKWGIKNTQAWRILAVGIGVIIVYLVALVYGLKILFKKQSAPESSNQNSVTVAVMVFVIVYVTAVGILLEAGENQRHRFMIEPFCWILCTLFLQSLLSKHTSSVVIAKTAFTPTEHQDVPPPSL